MIAARVEGEDEEVECHVSRQEAEAEQGQAGLEPGGRLKSVDLTSGGCGESAGLLCKGKTYPSHRQM